MVTNSAERLTPDVAALMQEIERLNVDHKEARSELVRMAREPEVLPSETAGLLASRSWRLTYPVRLVISKLRG